MTTCPSLPNWKLYIPKNSQFLIFCNRKSVAKYTNHEIEKNSNMKNILSEINLESVMVMMMMMMIITTIIKHE